MQFCFAPSKFAAATPGNAAVTVGHDAQRRQQHHHRRVTMKIVSVIMAGLLALGSAASAHDPVHTDGDKYKVRLENARVRVLEYRDRPGEKTHEHSHPAFVVVALSPFKRRLVLPDGKVIIREFQTGDVMFSDAQTHIGENVGESPTHILMIEMK
jgi:beta-alanine degradation protein BauB